MKPSSFVEERSGLWLWYKNLGWQSESADTINGATFSLSSVARSTGLLDWVGIFLVVERGSIKGGMPGSEYFFYLEHCLFNYIFQNIFHQFLVHVYALHAGWSCVGQKYLFAGIWLFSELGMRCAYKRNLHCISNCYQNLFDRICNKRNDYDIREFYDLFTFKNQQYNHHIFPQ